MLRLKVRIEWEALCSGHGVALGTPGDRAAARHLLCCGLMCKVPAGAGGAYAALYPETEKAGGWLCDALVLFSQDGDCSGRLSGESASGGAILGQPRCCPFCSPTPRCGGQGRPELALCCWFLWVCSQDQATSVQWQGHPRSSLSITPQICGVCVAAVHI